MAVKSARGIHLSILKKGLKIDKEAVEMMGYPDNKKNLYVVTHTIGHEAN